MDPVAASLAALAIIAAVAAVVLAAWERRRVLEAFASEREQWQAERAELISRIQRPDLIPIRPPRPREASSDETDQRAADLEAYRRVGTAQPMREAG